MEDKLKSITDKLEVSEDVLEKINLQNLLAWELRLSNPKKSLVIAEQTYKSAKEENYTRGLADSLKTQASTYSILSNHNLSFQKGIEALDLFRVLKEI